MTAVSVTTFLKANWLSILVLLVIAGFVGLHIIWYIRPSNIKSMDDLNARLTDGEPMVIEFYTNL